MRKPEWPMSFNLWTAQGTWFWSLVYPNRHGGAIGAAASEAEAMGEAQAAIERLPQLDDEGESVPAPCDDLRFTQPFHSLKDAPFHICCEVDRASDDLGCSQATRKQTSKMRAMAESYNNLWQLTLQQYSARVAGVWATLEWKFNP
jgi:hypothetical protein